jgi:ABC-type glycerol-3-phosphate transport system substrate-binding protein
MRAFGQDETLHFWQFYAPDGGVKTQVDWFTKMVDEWNAKSETKVTLDYIVDYTNGTTLQTSFASNQGPDIFLISPGDFLRYYNGGVLLDLTLTSHPKLRPISSKGSSPRARWTASFMAFPWSSNPCLLLFGQGLRRCGSQRERCSEGPGTNCSSSATN